MLYTLLSTFKSTLEKIKSSGPKVMKLFFILNTAEHEIYPAHNVKMPTIVGILTFISMINTTSERLKARNLFYLLVL